MTGTEDKGFQVVVGWRGMRYPRIQHIREHFEYMGGTTRIKGPAKGPLRQCRIRYNPFTPKCSLIW